MFPSSTKSTSAILKNQETSSGSYTNTADGGIQTNPSTAIDLTLLRRTATPAGSNGRIAIHGSDSTKLAEANAPTTEVKMYIASWAPDSTEAPLPSSRAEITAGVRYLASCGFNAIRIHGLEYWLMSGTISDYDFPADRLADFDWFLSECKRMGLYWILNPRQPELYQAGPSRFSMPGTAKNYKQRIFTQQDARDMWRKGFDLLYNRVNVFTGINILQDPALFLIECFNECSAAFIGSFGGTWPTVWRTRDYAQGTGAQTWLEWLQTTYTTVANVNTAWGTSYPTAGNDFTVIPDPSGTELPGITMVGSQRTIDVSLYIGYLDDQLAAYFQGEISYFSYSGLYSSTISFPQSSFLRTCSKDDGNSLVNLHNYTFVALPPANGAVLSSGALNAPVWNFESWVYTAGSYTGGKPAYIGEYGWPYWGYYRNQYPMLGAYACHGGVSGVSFFHQGDFFSSQYNTSAKGRIRALYPYTAMSDPVCEYTQLALFFAFASGYVSEGTLGKTLILNDKYYGFNPRSTGRVNRAYFNYFLPVQLYGGLTKVQTTWTSDTTDDSLNNVENALAWSTLCANLQGAGILTADNISYTSSVTNSGTITAVATTGVVGSVTASLTQPVLTLSGSNTLVDNDRIQITNITGAPGTWPGTQNRGNVATIIQTGTANRVQVISGLDLTDALSGANFSAGTWSEFGNEMQSGNKQLLTSRRRKACVVDTTKFKYLAVTSSFTVPTIAGISSVSLSNDSSFFVASIDGAAIASSSRLLIGFCGTSQNTGDSLSGSTLTTSGTYPIQIKNNTLTFTLTVTTPLKWKLYRLNETGQRVTEETIVSRDVDANLLNITLNTGTINPTIWWELVQA